MCIIIGVDSGSIGSVDLDLVGGVPDCDMAALTAAGSAAGDIIGGVSEVHRRRLEDVETVAEDELRRRVPTHGG